MPLRRLKVRRLLAQLLKRSDAILRVLLRCVFRNHRVSAFLAQQAKKASASLT